MFPNAPNSTIVLIKIANVPNAIGVRRPTIISSKEVVGIVKSITASETQASAAISKTYDIKASIQSFLYDEEKNAVIKGKVYQVEKTYLNGQFIELYLSLTDINLEEMENGDAW